MTTPTENNHNKHLDLLHNYKIYLLKHVTEIRKNGPKIRIFKKMERNYHKR